MSVTADALEAARIGFRVIPLREASKKPSIYEWQKNAINDEGYIKGWFDGHPNNNYGLVMGLFGNEGLMVGAVDIDDKSGTFGPNGYETLEDWEEMYGPLPETATCKTGNGGMHMFYLFEPDEFPRHYANQTMGVDFRGAGSYVVGSGSTNERGALYMWEQHPDEFPIAKADANVIKFVNANRPIGGQEAGETGSWVMPTEKLTHDRNWNTYRYMCSLQARGYSDEDIMREGLRFNDEWCDPPKPKSTVMSSWREAIRKPKGELIVDNGGGTLYAAACACEGIEYDPSNDPFKNGERERQKVHRMANGLPAIEPLSVTAQSPVPPRKPEVICGTLREQQKLLIQGASKAGKTWLTIELAVALATGTKWLGNECRKGRVLYCDFELQRESYLNRLKSVCDAVGVDFLEACQNIDLWSLRGHARSMEEMVSIFLPAIRARNYQMIILDPFYKLMTGSENDAEMVGAFCRELDRLCVEGDIAVTYVHHYSKGAQGDKSPMDRSSGSGVFARDADALIDLAELEVDEDARIDNGLEETGCFRVTSVLRDFPMRPPVDIFFRDMHHFEDTEGVLGEFSVASFASKGGKSSGETRKRQQKGRAQEYCDSLFDYLVAVGHSVDVKTLLKDERFKVDVKTFKNYVSFDSRFATFKDSRSQNSLRIDIA